MRVIFNSLCTKGALAVTRRVLDQFAERSTPSTWQTVITQEGLDTVLRVLRAKARKNTAVACFRVTGSRHALLWIVGNRKRFNEEGRCASAVLARKAAPTDSNWVYGQLIRDLADLGGLLHDLGKATSAFQRVLQSSVPLRSQIRHEWVSLRMIEAFVGTDTDEQWLTRLAAPTPQDDARWLDILKKDFLHGLDKPEGSPFAALTQAPMAQALGWLVVSHHRLPTRPEALVQGSFQEIRATWNETPTILSEIPDHWTFPKRCPAITNTAWRIRVARVASRLLSWKAQHPENPVDNPFVMHLARLCLMLGDHYYSALPPTSSRRVQGIFGPLWANTEEGRFNQTLDEHLLGVSRHSAAIASTLPLLGSTLTGFQGVSRMDEPAHGKYTWQNKATLAATQIKSDALTHGAFVVNLASTGCGKTLMNAKIIRAVSDRMRCAFALGLRTLTIQTGKAYQSYLGVQDMTQIALQVGGLGITDLFAHKEKFQDPTGSKSADPLNDPEAVFYEGMGDHPVLRHARSTRLDAIVEAPLLVCTVDHLIPATDSLRAGRQIAPMLRLLTSDVVLDEPDDFDLKDLPALTRLVHWAGLLGSRVVLSSATLSPDLSQGLFQAYAAGRRVFAENMGQTFDGIPCLWVDENSTQSCRIRQDTEYEAAHQTFAQGRATFLAGLPKKRQGVIVTSWDGSTAGLRRLVLTHACNLHRAHGMADPVTGAWVSFGVCRLANIGPLWDLAKALYCEGQLPPGYHLHLCTYHSQFPLALRSHTEAQLASALDRKDPVAVFAQRHVREAIDRHPASHHIFLVLGSPVVQIGQDHDYDWGIMEPSDMRSLIQLSGRVRRHREGSTPIPNVVVLARNLHSFHRANTGQPLPAYRYPGFEDADHMFQSHDAKELFRPEELDQIDSRPLLLKPAQLTPRRYFTDLEHTRLAETLRPSKGLNGASCYALPPRDATLTGTLPKFQRFRAPTRPETKVRFALVDEQEVFQELDMGISTHRNPIWSKAGDKLVTVPPKTLVNSQVTPWGHVAIPEAMHCLAQDMGKPLEYCYTDFGYVQLPENREGFPTLWDWHPWLGFHLRA